MKHVFYIIFTIGIIALMVLLFVPKPMKGFTVEEAKSLCKDYCRIACKLNASEKNLEQINNIEFFIHNKGNQKCLTLIGKCSC